MDLTINSVGIKNSKNNSSYLSNNSNKSSSFSNYKVIDFAQALLRQNINEGNGKELEITQGRVEDWCADAVNYIYQKSLNKNPFGLNKDGTYKYNTVKGLKYWAEMNSRFVPALNKSDIEKHLELMKPGDIIIWKSLYKAKMQGKAEITRHASHTGIVKEVKNGQVNVIEGNANVLKKNSKGELLIVDTEAEGKNGNQAIGDFQEENPYDGLIEKKYDAQELMDSGYTGYIDMKNIRKSLVNFLNNN